MLADQETGNMESNKDDSLKCIRLSSECLNKKDYEKALKFAHKSQRLYPSKEAEGNIC